MSNAEQLRLEASMRDNASPVVRKLKKELDAIRQTPGMAEATKWFGQFEEGAKGFVKSGGDAANVISAMGIGGLTAAASVATLITQFKELGERTLAIKELGRQVGLTNDQVNAFGRAGQSFGVGTDVMQGALNHLAGQMPEFLRNSGALYQQLSRWPDLIRKLQGEGTEDQLEDIFKFLGQKKLQNEPQLQKQILGAFFGSGDQLEALFARGATGFLDELRKQQASLGPITDDLLKQAQAYRDATIDFNTALTNFETGAGPAFLKQMTDLLKGAKDFVDVLGMGGNDKGADKSPDHQDHRSWGQAFGDAANDAGKALGKAWDWLSEATKDKKPNPLLHKSSFGGADGGLLHRAFFVTGAPADASGSVFVGMIAEGTKIGFLAAMRELMATKDLEKDGGGAGFTNASYEPGGSGLGGGRRGGGGAGVGFDGPVPLGSKAGSLTRLIDEEARRAGVDPRIMEGIRAGESLHRNSYDKKDDALESSWGPFQLNRRRGLGVTFEHDTGLDLRNPSSIAAQARWVAQYLKRGGSLHAWAGFHGPRDADPRWGESGYVPNPQAGEAAVTAGGFDLGHLRSLHVLNEQCVSLARAAVGASGSVREWRRGVGALEGTLKPGTPVATFLDSFGRQSGRYAGGGLGTMGAHLDHAGVFQSYIRDKLGHIVGMNMAEQYKGSHGVHARAYMFGQGWGEKNASNYRAILGADGGFLGGANNPMSRRATGLADAGRGEGDGRNSKHQLDIHLHDRGGAVRSTSHRGEGPMEVNLRTWPTMTEPSFET